MSQRAQNYLAADTLDLLLLRLTWPSAFVAERACVALGGLLVHPAHSAECEEALLEWLVRQELESVACHGLLAFAQAQIRGAELRRSLLDRLANAVRPSLLAWLLLTELVRQPLPAPLWAQLHSGTAPSDFKTNADFGRQLNKFNLPTMYLRWVNAIERHENIPFLLQWAYEWENVLDRFTLKPSEEALQFGRAGHDSAYAILDFPMTEVYRSALLRALAWAHDQHGMDLDDCLQMAACICPVDLGLWRVRPSAPPNWWPAPSISQGSLDSAPAEIWSGLESRLTRESENSGVGWTLAQAQGPLRISDTRYELTIWGVFQRCHGPEVPAADTLADWCQSLDPLEWRGPSWLRLEGRLPEVPPSDGVERFADWEVAPAAYPLRHSIFPWWQWWQFGRSLWLPTPFLDRSPLDFKMSASGIDLAGRSGRVGKGEFWTVELSEMQQRPVPPAVGQSLYMRRDILRSYARKAGWTFCWVCQLTAYTRKYSYERFQAARFSHVIGASSVIQLVGQSGSV